MIRVLYTGSRYARLDQTGHRQTIWRALCEIAAEHPHGPVVLVHGGGVGGDQIAVRAAHHLGWQTEPHPARWTGPCLDTCEPGHRTRRCGQRDLYCPAAGAYRNQAMVDLGAAVCVATPMRFSKGTWDCVRRARAAGIRCRGPGVAGPVAGWCVVTVHGFGRQQHLVYRGDGTAVDTDTDQPVRLGVWLCTGTAVDDPYPCQCLPSGRCNPRLCPCAGRPGVLDHLPLSCCAKKASLP